jgi:transposase InsO family protein
LNVALIGCPSLLSYFVVFCLRNGNTGNASRHCINIVVQHASKEYVSALIAHGIRISMSRSGNPFDNGKAERIIRTLKYEQIHMNGYETLGEVRASVSNFINSVYNQK